MKASLSYASYLNAYSSYVETTSAIQKSQTMTYQRLLAYSAFSTASALETYATKSAAITIVLQRGSYGDFGSRFILCVSDLPVVNDNGVAPSALATGPSNTLGELGV